MNHLQAEHYIEHCVDDALAVRKKEEMPANAVLVGWESLGNVMFVAVWSYLGPKLDEDEAVEYARDYLNEIGWLDDPEKEPDYVL